MKEHLDQPKSVNQLQIRLFGHPQLLCNGLSQGADLPYKALALVYYLALSEKPVGRESIAALLWPDADAKMGKQSLRVLLTKVRKALAPFVDITVRTVALRHAQIAEIDVISFRSGVDEIQRQKAGGQAPGLALWQRALDCYAGEFLQGFHVQQSAEFEDWVALQRENLRQMLLSNLLMLAEAYEAVAQPAQAIGVLSHLLTLEPWSEAAYRQQIRLLAAAGRTSEAVHQYEQCAAMLKQQFDATPSPEFVALYDEIRLSEWGTAAWFEYEDGIAALDETLSKQEEQARQQDARRATLDLPPAPFCIGLSERRDALLAVLHTKGPPHLVALEGIGGIGKTTLAHTVLEACIEQGFFEHLAWFSAKPVELTTLGAIRPIRNAGRTASDLMHALMRQLLPQVPLTPTSDIDEIVQLLHQHLRSGPNLIVVDNLETMDDLDEILPLLERLANPTKFLITSRQQISSTQPVHRIAVQPLTPDDALRLLRQVAQQNNLAHVAEYGDDALQPVVQAVGGNPLALRLVVGLLTNHALADILDGLTDSLIAGTEGLYSYIYQEAWEGLQEISRQVLLAMLLVRPEGEPADFLIAATGIDQRHVHQGLAELRTINLVDVQRTRERHTYTIHSLTRSFLYNEQLAWR